MKCFTSKILIANANLLFQALKDIFEVEDSAMETEAVEKPLNLKSDNPISVNESC